MKDIFRKAALASLLSVAAVTSAPLSVSADITATSDVVTSIYAKASVMHVFLATARHTCGGDTARFVVTSANLSTAGGGFKDVLVSAFLSGRKAQLDYVCNGTSAEITVVRAF